MAKFWARLDLPGLAFISVLTFFLKALSEELLVKGIGLYNGVFGAKIGQLGCL